MYYLVIGLGVSGRDVISYLLNLNHTVYGIDDNERVWQKSEVEQLVGLGLKRFSKTVNNIDLAILSSGIHPESQSLQHILKRAIPTISEAEFALKQIKTKCVAITGTKGKTTTTYLLKHILSSCGYSAEVAGNVGISFAKVIEDQSDYLICELSSYQLFHLQNRFFDYGILLNITEDHIDWHGSYLNYAKAKIHLENLVNKELFVDRCTYESHKALFTKKPRLVGDDLTCDIALINQTIFYNLEKITLPKAHSFYPFEWMNVLHAIAIAFRIGCNQKQLIEALSSFKRLEHRLEKFATIDGVDFINDSKGTSIAAFLKAVHSFQNRRIILIMGGQAKGQNFSTLKDQIKANIKHIFLIGEAKLKLSEALKAFSQSCEESLQICVTKAMKIANKNDIVLLSPSCASLDQFENYIDRGEKFKYYVNEIRNERESKWQKSIQS